LPAFVDLTKDLDSYGFRPGTAVQAKQLDAIYAHNLALPPRKKAKESINEFEVGNIYAKQFVERNDKKKTKDLIYKHFNIGFVDGTNLHNPDLPANAIESYHITN